MKAAEVGFKGHAPKLEVGEGNPELTKYCSLWAMEEYRRHSPGEHFIHYFMRAAKPREGASVLDLGCGTGRGGRRLFDLGFNVTLLDFTRNCLDPDVREIVAAESATPPAKFRFLTADLEHPIPVEGEYGYCCDVMEHIPPDKVNRVLENILKSVNHAFFAICTAPDAFGEAIGETLHLSVHPYGWWLDRFNRMGCVIHWSDKIGSYAFFYVTAWEDAQEFVRTGKVNNTEEAINENIRHNCQQGYKEIMPHLVNEEEVMILGGGPSLTQHEYTIRKMRADGVKLVTLNGTYNWCIERGIVPSATVVVDSREFNARFTKPVVKDVAYFLASQAHPSIFEGIPKEQIYLWHSMSDRSDDIVREYIAAPFFIPGGSTVLLRTIPLLRMLGFHRFHLFGCDSCLTGDDHHAYAQSENDGSKIVRILVEESGRWFSCHPWMASQAREFVTMIQRLGDTFDLIVHGDGLLSHIIETGATMIAPKEE